MDMSCTNGVRTVYLLDCRYAGVTGRLAFLQHETCIFCVTHARLNILAYTCEGGDPSLAFQVKMAMTLEGKRPLEIDRR